MRAYYSLISVLIRPEIDEKISLGLLVLARNEVFFEYSKTKLSVCKDLLQEYVYHAVKMELASVRNSVLNFKKDQEINHLFKGDTESQFNFFDESHISYLSNYKNNLLVFSKPQKLSIDVDVNIFNTLYEKYIDSDPYSKGAEEGMTSFEKFKREELPKLRKYYNTNYTVDKDILPGALLPLKFDLVGKNDFKVFGKAIDLERRKYYVEHDVNALYPLENLSPDSKKFIISQEPEKHFHMQHQIWKNLKNSDWWEYVDLSEIDKLEEYAIEHNVEPIASTLDDEDVS